MTFIFSCFAIFLFFQYKISPRDEDLPMQVEAGVTNSINFRIIKTQTARPDSREPQIETQPAAELSGLSEEELCQKKISDQIEKADDHLQRKMRILENNVGHWYFQHQSPPSETTENQASGNFLLALANAGLLDGVQPKQVNDQLALQQLTYAHMLDPENSAPLVYLAFLQHRLKLFDQENETLKKISQTKRFDSYIGQLTENIYGSVENSSDLLNAISLISTLPIPSFGGDFSKYIVQKKISQIAEQIFINESRRNTDLPENPPILETMMARSWLQKIDPERKDLPSPEWVKARLLMTLAHNENEGFYSTPNICDLNWYWPLVQRFRSKR